MTAELRDLLSVDGGEEGAPGGGGGGSNGEETWWADGYRFAWGRLWEARAQELGDDPEAPAVHSVIDRTSRRAAVGPPITLHKGGNGGSKGFEKVEPLVQVVGGG